MEREIYSGSSGGPLGYGRRLQQKERKRLKFAPDIGNEKGHHPTKRDFVEESSQLAGKKRRRNNEGSRRGDAENEEEAGPETLKEETILSKAVDDVRQLHHRVNYFTHEVSTLLEEGEAHFRDTSTTFEGMLQLHKKIMETWESAWEDITETLRNMDIVIEEICIYLREAREDLQKLQASASSAAAIFDGI